MPDEIVSIGTADNKKYLLDMRDVTSRFVIPKHFGAERFLDWGQTPRFRYIKAAFLNTANTQSLTSCQYMGRVWGIRKEGLFVAKVISS